jgi:hypothetical protein
LIFQHDLVSWRNFAMRTLKTLNTELVVNNLSFLLVTHMVTTNARFNSYELSKTGHGAELSRQTGYISEISGLRAYDE